MATSISATGYEREHMCHPKTVCTWHSKGLVAQWCSAFRITKNEGRFTLDRVLVFSSCSDQIGLGDVARMTGKYP
jgi:hypothetical protein